MSQWQHCLARYNSLARLHPIPKMQKLDVVQLTGKTVHCRSQLEKKCIANVTFVQTSDTAKWML